MRKNLPAGPDSTFNLMARWRRKQQQGSGSEEQEPPSSHPVSQSANQEHGSSNAVAGAKRRLAPFVDAAEGYQLLTNAQNIFLKNIAAFLALVLVLCEILCMDGAGWYNTSPLFGRVGGAHPAEQGRRVEDGDFRKTRVLAMLVFLLFQAAGARLAFRMNFLRFQVKLMSRVEETEIAGEGTNPGLLSGSLCAAGPGGALDLAMAKYGGSGGGQPTAGHDVLEQRGNSMRWEVLPAHSVRQLIMEEEYKRSCRATSRRRSRRRTRQQNSLLALRHVLPLNPSTG